MHVDRWGQEATTDRPDAVLALEAATLAFLAHDRSTPDHMAACFAADPDLPLAHAAKGLMCKLQALGCHETNAAAALAAARAGIEARGATARERGYVEALAAWCAGDWWRAIDHLDRVLVGAPGDPMAIKTAQIARFMLGDLDGMRRSVESVLPAWDEERDGYGYLLGCQAFTLEETGETRAAEATGRHAVALEPRDAWGLHAVAHVMETEGRPEDGIAWLSSKQAAWAHCNNFGFHVWWHWALFMIDAGEPDGVLELYDTRIRPNPTDDYRDIANGASILWRLEALGLPVGERWAELADLAERHGDEHLLVFADAHYLTALVGAGRLAAADAFVASARAAARRGETTQIRLAGDLGLALLQVIREAGQAGAGATIDRLAPLLPALHRIGGSHAQRDVFVQLFVDAALTAGRPEAARAALAARHAHRGAPGLWGADRQRRADALAGSDALDIT
ncbi:MAG: tetratricopeptide repeat protein [Azospirillaceae bacterium]